MIIICSSCGREYVNVKGSGHTALKCNSCMTNGKRFEKKKLYAKLFGTACKVCGYKRCSRAMNYHHKFPENKSFEISGAHGRSIKNLLEEICKCILLCANCHAEVHDGIIDVSNVPMLTLPDWYILQIELEEKQKIKQEIKKPKFISSYRKIVTDINLFKQIVWTLGVTSAGRFFNVKHSTIRRYCKKSNIPLPPQGTFKRKQEEFFKVFGTELPPLEDNPEISKERLAKEIEHNKIATKNSHSNRKFFLSKEDLEIFVWNYTITGTARFFEVTPELVSSRCSDLQVIKPPPKKTLDERKQKYQELFGKPLLEIPLDRRRKKE